MSPRATALVCLAALVSTVGCTVKSVHWIEEVALSDGRIVRVERDEQYSTGCGSVGGPACAMALNTRLRVLDTPASAQWADHLVPLLLDVDPANGELVLICTTDSVEKW